MQDRRQIILDAGLAILREEGLAGFTQPKVAAKAGLKQGNLTYYFPTRTELLAAVAELAIENQMTAAAGLVGGTSTVQQAEARIAAAVTRHENTRVLVALNQAADQEPALQHLFQKLTDGFVDQLIQLMGKLDLGATQTRVDLVHALFVGLSVIDLATSRENGEARAKAVLNTAFSLLSSDQSPKQEG